MMLLVVNGQFDPLDYRTLSVSAYLLRALEGN